MSSLNLQGLYIHWPYCRTKCPYCDFFSLPGGCPDEKIILNGYQRDIQRVHVSSPFTSIFIGGGTPSLMSEKLLGDLFDLLHTHFKFTPDIEITIEANPNALNLNKMHFLKSIGVNRLSLGVQALNDTDLTFLGRTHTVQEALDCLEQASGIFSNINMDLIYARPHQTLKAWEEELKRALTWGLPHYSLYQLTLEEGTPFYQKHLKLPKENTAKRLYQLTNTLMAEAGRPAYEISNYAIPGKECQHNLTYWDYRPYFGIGPAAQSRWRGKAIQNPKNIAKWLKGERLIETLTPYQKKLEKILMGSRLFHKGLPLSLLDPNGVKQALDYKWGQIKNKRFYITDAGHLVLNQVVLAVCPEDK